jgi:hypothetical protein
LDGLGPSLEGGVDLGELVFGAGQADFEPFDLAEPAFAGSLDDPGFQVVADLFQPASLRRTRPKERTSDTCLTEMILTGRARLCFVHCLRTVTDADSGMVFPGRVAQGHR